MSPRNPKDQLLDHYLQGDSEITRLYRDGASDQPSEALDETILAASRREARSGPRPAHSPFARNWLIPASMAAVLVLGIGLVTFMGEETGMYVEPTKAPMLEREKTQGAQRLDSLKEKSKIGEVQTDTVLPQPAEDKGPARRALPKASGRQAVTSVPAAPAPAPATVESKSLLRKQQYRFMSPAVRQEEGAGDVSRGLLLERAREADRTDQLSPEDWLDYIEELRRRGRYAEADKELVEFRKRYPDYSKK